jgi:hypothetical protein
VNLARQPHEFTDLDDPAWLGLFENVESSWFRLETLQVYAVDYERNEYEQFLRDGQLIRPPGPRQHMIRQHTTAGRALRRVHVVEEPLTDYLRYEFAAYRQNGEAGEDIRIIPTSPPAWPTGLPKDLDFWLFDDRDVWDMHYTPAGQFVRAVRSKSPEHIAECRQWRDRALALSVAFSSYIQRVSV